jgi:hypothetical protein
MLSKALGGATKLIKRNAGLLGTAASLIPGGAVIGRIAGLAGRALPAAGVGMAIGRVTSGSNPGIPSLPGLPYAQGGRQPAGTLTRLGQRIVPGGKTGRELMPYGGTEYDRLGRPIAVHPELIERHYAPPGYVIVQMGDTKIGMLKGVARSMGLWKGRPRPPISGYDARAIRRAASAQKRVQKLGRDVGLRLSMPAAGKGRFKKKRR